MLSSQRQIADGQSLPSNAQVQEKQSSERVFRLIDAVLSFEACLYHQVFPLALEGNRLILGMVNPEDNAALDYVERILSYMNYSLVPQRMTAEEHQATLSAYLNYTKVTKPVTETLRSIASGHPATQKAVKARLGCNLEQAQSTAKSPKGNASTSQNDQPTFILDREDITSLKVNAAKAQPSTYKPSTPSQGVEKQSSQPAQGLPALKVQASHLNSPVEVMLTLPPKKMLQELLQRVLEKGIGRLHFERTPQHCRIVCTQDGQLQSVLPIMPVQFQALIQELKQLTHLPLVPVQKPEQVEIERFYQKERLLLRLQLTPSSNGEQATVQILRGAALQFYQQQQLKHLSRDTRAIALTLKQKLNQLRDCTRSDATFASKQQETLLVNQLLENLEQYLQKHDRI